MRNLFRTRASWAVYDQILVSGANFVSTLIVARMLAPDHFAMFSLASLSILFFASFQRTLVTQPMNVFGATEAPSDLASRYIGMMYIQRMMIPLAILLLTATGLVFFPDRNLIIGASSYLASFFLQEMIRRFYYTTGEIKAALMNDLISYGGQLVILILIFALGYKDAALAFTALAVTSLVAFIHGQRKIDKIFSKLKVVKASKKTLLLQHWTFSKWIVLSQFVFWGATQAYPFMLAGQSTYKDVADFNVANSLLNVMNIIRLMLGNYLPSKVTLIYKNGGTKALKDFLFKVLIISTGASFILIGALIIGSEWLVAKLFADKYPLAGKLVGWLAIAQFSSIISVVTNAAALALRTTNWIFYANAVGTIFSLIFGSLLIQKYGVWGAVVGLAIANAIPAVIQGSQVLYRCRESNND